MNKQKARFYILSALVAFAILGIGTSPSFASGASGSISQASSHASMLTTVSASGIVASNLVNSGIASPSAVKILASGQSGAQPIVVYKGFVYWYNYGNGQINRVNESGGTVDTITTVNTADGIVFGIAVGGNYVYWTFYNTTTPGCCGDVYKTQISNGATTTLEHSSSYVNYGIAVSSKYVFFVETNDNIYRMSLTGSGLTVIATAPSKLVWQVTYSSTFVYWYDLCTGQVGKVSQNGGTATLLSPALANCGTEVATGIEPLVVNGTHVYWTFNFYNSVIKEYNNSIDAVTTSGTGFNILHSALNTFYTGVGAFKSNVLFADYGDSILYTIPYTGGTPKVLASGYFFEALSVFKGNVYATALTYVLRTKA